MAGSSLGVLRSVWSGIKQLNPAEVREEAERRLSIGLVGTEAEMDAMLAWLAQAGGAGKAGEMIQRFNADKLVELGKPARNCDIVICASGCHPDLLGVPEHKLFLWRPSEPDRTVTAILDENRVAKVHLALAHRFPVFRRAMNVRVIRGTSLENAGFVASTSIGTIIPNPLAPLASIAEAAGDVVVLTANQVRMLFRLAAANDKPMGYRELFPQISSIVAAAFGWRALAREVVGLIPFGGGLVGKAAVAYAGTWAIGEGLIVYFTTGRKMTKEELNDRFQRAMGEARQVASQVVNSVRQKVRGLTPSGGKVP